MGPESETGSRSSGDRVAVHRDLLSGILGGIQRVGARSVSGQETGGAASLTNLRRHVAVSRLRFGF